MRRGYDDSYGWGGYPSAPSKAQKAKQAQDSVKKLTKKGMTLRPVVLSGLKISTSWWGLAWCRNLERYADFSNRIGRGKSYVRSGAVIDLRIGPGLIEALVQGSRVKPYEVRIKVTPLSQATWQKIVERCNRRVDTLESLVNGLFPADLEAFFSAGGEGLFPSPKEIGFDCSCPDWASMCKHVAAVLYGVGNRLDDDPLLFFTLRGVDMNDLIKRTVEEKVHTMLSHAEVSTARIIPDEKLAGLFGL
jgi:uncharacterized Zn finger protein